MNFEKIRRYFYLVAFITGSALLAYLFFKHVFVYLLPFFAGWFIAFAVRPVATTLSQRVKIKERYLRLILTLVIFIVLLGLSMLGIWLLSREVWTLLSELGESGSIEEFISGLMSSGGFFGRLFGDFGDYVADVFYRLAISMLTSLGSGISSIVSAIPEVLFFTLILVVSSVYFALGLEEINASVKRILPESAVLVMSGLKNRFYCAFGKYVRSYLLLLVITFVEMLAGLCVVHAPYPVIMALVIALLDMLPVLGVGFVLIPWGVWSFVIGNTRLGIGLTVLFVFHTVLRQIIEPRIVGKNLGVHPLITLITIYLGYSLFGFVGLLLVPILTVLVNIALEKNDSAEVA